MVADVKIITGGLLRASHDSFVDPRASVSPLAEIAPGCSVGPFAVIGPEVRIGSGCQVDAHAVLQGPMTMGCDNLVHSFACIGGSPQDLRYRGENTKLIVGSGNEFRENVTVNRGTSQGGGVTTLGNNNLLMAGAHVAHDCRVENHVIMANNATIAGHTKVQNYVVFGGMVGVGQYLRIGESAMLAAGSMIEREVPPFCIVSGDRARLRAINRVGLQRRGIDGLAKTQIKSIFRSLKRRGTTLESILSQFGSLADLTPEARRMLVFLKQSKRGLTR